MEIRWAFRGSLRRWAELQERRPGDEPSASNLRAAGCAGGVDGDPAELHRAVGGSEGEGCGSAWSLNRRLRAPRPGWRHQETPAARRRHASSVEPALGFGWHRSPGRSYGSRSLSGHRSRPSRAGATWFGSRERLCCDRCYDRLENRTTGAASRKQENPSYGQGSRGMEPSGLEPLTPCMPCRCSTS